MYVMNLNCRAVEENVLSVGEFDSAAPVIRHARQFVFLLEFRRCFLVVRNVFGFDWTHAKPRTSPHFVGRSGPVDGRSFTTHDADIVTSAIGSYCGFGRNFAGIVNLLQL